MTTAYPRALILLHWILALLLIVALAAGKIMLDDVPNTDPGKAFSLTAHMTVGGVILILMIARVIVRLRGPNPASDSKLASGLHVLLYVGVFVMLASGITMSLTFGLADILFLGQGSLPEDFGGSPARPVHGIVANALILLVLLHIAAAVLHMVRRDGIMARMSLRK